MGEISREEIKGYRVGDEIRCIECICQEEENDLREDDFITIDEVEKGEILFFCDKCKEQI